MTAISYFTPAHGRVDLYLAQSHDHLEIFTPPSRHEASRGFSSRDRRRNGERQLPGALLVGL